jgi:3-oxoacyl-[acyl-carrier-protein] synthase II
MRRVAVTGLGAVTPLGNDAESTWRAALAGESGIDWIRSFDPGDAPVRVAAEVKDFDPTQVASPKDVRKLERNVLLSLGAAREAMGDAGLNGFDPMRVGIVFGTAIGGVNGILEQEEIRRERGAGRVSPNFLPNVLVDSASGQLAISLGVKGPNYAVVSACATGSHAIGEAAELVKRGDADAVLAGGAEACMHPLILAGFTAMRGLAVEDEDPPRASRPFDVTRAGFVMGEGACVFVLEELEAAEARGAKIYAEVLGYGSATETGGPLRLATGRAMARAITTALNNAELPATAIDHINAHGCALSHQDVCDTNAFKHVFGTRAYDVPITSIKSMIGQPFAAAGVLQTAAACLSLEHQLLPPTINQEVRDPRCDLDYVPNVSRAAKLNRVLINTQGTGGSCAALVIDRPDTALTAL